MLSLHTWGKYKGCRMGRGELITNISADWPPSVCPLGAKCTNTKSARAKESRVRANMRRREYRAYLCCDSGWRAVVRSTGPAGEREPGGPARQSPRPPGRTEGRRKKRELMKRGAYHTAAEPGEALAWSASWWRYSEHNTDTSADRTTETDSSPTHSTGSQHGRREHTDEPVPGGGARCFCAWARATNSVPSSSAHARPLVLRQSTDQSSPGSRLHCIALACAWADSITCVLLSSPLSRDGRTVCWAALRSHHITTWPHIFTNSCYPSLDV